MLHLLLLAGQHAHLYRAACPLAVACADCGQATQGVCQLQREQGEEGQGELAGSDKLIPPQLSMMHKHAQQVGTSRKAGAL